MESSQFIRAQLVSRTNADCSDKEAKNNRWHYHLRFDQSIGWDWIEDQVAKCSAEMDVNLEMWEIHPSGVSDFELEVREIQRREGIDKSQKGLDSFSTND